MITTLSRIKTFDPVLFYRAYMTVSMASRTAAYNKISSLTHWSDYDGLVGNTAMSSSLSASGVISVNHQAWDLFIQGSTKRGRLEGQPAPQICKPCLIKQSWCE